MSAHSKPLRPSQHYRFEGFKAIVSRTVDVIVGCMDQRYVNGFCFSLKWFSCTEWYEFLRIFAELYTQGKGLLFQIKRILIVFTVFSSHMETNGFTLVSSQLKNGYIIGFSLFYLEKNRDHWSSVCVYVYNLIVIIVFCLIWNHSKRYPWNNIYMAMYQKIYIHIYILCQKNIPMRHFLWIIMQLVPNLGPVLVNDMQTTPPPP